MQQTKRNIVIVGPAASGKDMLRRRLEAKGYTYCKPYTTRPQRTGECAGDYNFVTDEEFSKAETDGIFTVVETYNGWKYGIVTKDLLTCNLFVMTPEYLVKLGRDFTDSSFIIYLNPDCDVRLKRLGERHDMDSAIRRFEADKEQFKDFTTYDIEIKNENF